MKRCDKLTKTVQRRLYDFLLTKYGLTLLCLSILSVFLCIIQLSDTILEYRLAQLRQFINLNNSSLMRGFNLTKANLINLNRFDNEEPDSIDVVYTWVNGSDPEHLKELRKYKLNNINRNNSFMYAQVEFKDYLNNLIKNESKPSPCYHKLCMQTHNLIIINPRISQTDKQTFLTKAKTLFEADLYSNLTIDNFDSVYHQDKTNSSNLISNLSVLYTNNFDFNKLNKSSLEKIDFLFKQSFTFKNYQLFMGYYTIDCTLSLNCIRNVNRTFIIKKLKSRSKTLSLQDRVNRYSVDMLSYMLPNHGPSSTEDTTMDLPKNISDNLLYKLDYLHLPNPTFDGSQAQDTEKTFKKINNKDLQKSGTHLSVFKVKTQSIENDLAKYLNQTELFSFKNQHDKQVEYDIYRANIVWDLGDPFNEDIAENRFQDNDELKYSLRSVEKYAPWIRNIFIVTNGQVPQWLNLSNPKIKIIPHSDIFLDKTHLPTFSSPAIEAHLHRIPGLSKRFLYFNDDVLLAKQIWPDDFYTESKGFKFHLAWSLPGCSASCPNSWIRDGYCDKACNTSECDFDGGDCDTSLNKTKTNSPYDNARQAFMNQSQVLFPEFYCSTGCSTSWLADKYCDNSCNNLNCAFDMGDCGVNNFKQNLHEVRLSDLKSGLETLNLASGISSFYVNFTNEIEPFKITKADYEENKIVRSMSVVNKYSILTVLLMPLSYQDKIENKTDFNVIRVNIESILINGTGEVYNKALTFNLNSFTTLTTVHQTEAIKINRTLPGLTKVKRKLVSIKKDDSEPKMIEISSNKTDLPLQKVPFKNKLFQSLYENYKGYLNWSLRNEYLSEPGYKYKLNLFYEKLSNEINSTFTQMIESVSNSADFDPSDQDTTHLFNFLFNGNVKYMNEFEKTVLIDKYINETSQPGEKDVFLSFKKRKLLDTFADSLRHVNKLFNKIYGYMPRKVPAHMPHFIDKHIMSDLQKKFAKEFEATSRNRFRTSTDMQYAFSYYYYAMSEQTEFNSSVLFDEFDLNSNGQLDYSEIILINLRLSPRPFAVSDYVPHEAPSSEMYTLQSEFSQFLNQCLNSSKTGKLSKEEFLSCDNLVGFLREKFWSSDNSGRYKYKFETVGDEETKFVMISGDPLDIEVKLNNLIREPRKFVCLNDNIDYKMINEANRLKYLLNNFYSMLYPLRSSFEVGSSQLKEYSSSNLTRKKRILGIKKIHC